MNGGFDNNEGMPKLCARMEKVEVKWYQKLKCTFYALSSAQLRLLFFIL